MRNWKVVFGGKKITVIGLGLLGRAARDAKFLAEQGASLIVTDLKTETELAPSVELLKPFLGITYHLGGHNKSDFVGRDYILKAAGVPLDSPYIAEAEKNKIPIKMSASWFAELAGIPFVGVTGTRGKSTVTHMLNGIMRAAGREVLLGGNVRGVSTLSLLPQVTAASIALMELDSWQCRGFGDAGISPQLAVFTTFLDDHLDYYHGDRARYLGDKVPIFLNQKSEDTLIVSRQVADVLKERYGRDIRSHVVVADAASFPTGWKLKIPGEHNRANAMCAIEAARALGIDEAVIKEALEAFAGVPGRLELVREVNGVKVYNDTTATTPEATIAALRALDTGKKHIILIMGGADKGLDMHTLMDEIPKRTKQVVYLAGTGTERLAPLLPTGMLHHASLEKALATALKAGLPGDIVLFSPAFASFGMFKNEFDRGDQFNALVAILP